MTIDQIVSVEQGETIAFLMEALARETGAPVETKETHVSLIFLAGDLVFKLKRAVAFPYLDFSTPDRREAACRAEILLNSRAAPGLYLGLRAVTREKNGLAFDGPGEKCDCIVVMRRFNEADLFDVMARDHRLTPRNIEALAETLARFHANAQRFPGPDGATAMAHLLDLNDQSFEQCDIFPPESVRRLEKKFHDELARIAPLLDARAAEGFIRLCHGDLYLRNICLFEDKPTLFDCIEFDEALARIDVLYDVAFTLMDLWLCGRRDLANLLYNRYASALTRTLGDMPARIRDGYATLPFFMALRAGIRAHIAAGQARSGHGSSVQEHEDEARAYFELAENLLEPRPRLLVAIGGLSGSGKSTLAAALAPDIGPPPGARTLNSDRTRKAMHRLHPADQLPPEAYALNITAAVYLRLLSRAMDALSQERAVIMDAVYSMEVERDAVVKLAQEAGVPLLALWLDADPDVLRQRVRERPKGASDANLAVLERQLTLPVGDICWIRLDATAPDLVQQALDLANQVLAGQEPVLRN